MRLFKTNIEENFSEEKLKAIYVKHKEAFDKIIEDERRETLIIKNLLFAFKCDGKSFHKFPDGMALPLERLGKLQDYFMYINTGMSAKEWEEALNEFDRLLSKGIDNAKVASLMGALVIKVREMNEKVFHTELLYNIFSVLTVREDENPLEWNEEIHNHKIAAFKRNVRDTGSYFFFHQTELKQLNAYLGFSEAEWTTLWHDSERVQTNFKTTLQYIQQSTKKITKEEKTSTNT